MGRKSRLKKLIRENKAKPGIDINPDQLPASPSTDLNLQDSEGLHSIMPGEPPSEEKLAEMTAAYQKNIRNSPLFKEMVKQFGKEKAEKLLKECKVELRP